MITTEQIANWIGATTIIAVPFIIAIVIWFVKGLSLYKSARLREQKWFWLLMVLNPLGILSVIYLFIRRNKQVK